MTSSVALEGGIRQVSVNLHNAGFGIKTGDFASPRLWFAHTNSYARYDREAGVLEIVERPRMAAAGGPYAPKVWLDLPQAYRERRIDEVDVRARGYAEANGLTIGELTIDTWGDVVITGVHIGNTCLAKSVQGDVSAMRLRAPEHDNPERWPSAELIALSGTVRVAESMGAWRMTGREVHPEGAAGPQHISLLTPIHAGQPVRV